MDSTGLYERFRALNTWHSNGKRAPHKPLLALWAIGRALRCESRMVSYSEVHQELAKLLDRFGPPRKSVHTEYPFWRMRNDGVWEIDRPELVSTTARSGDAHKSSLVGQDIHGGLLEEDYLAFRKEPLLAWRIAESLIDAHFPDSYRDDILRATGIDAVLRRVLASQEAYTGQLGEERGAYDLGFEVSRRRKRRSAFRDAVLDAYRDRCAVCAFDVRMAGERMAVEAAHIQWHRDAGPPNVRNGLALCVLHHRLFDRGAFTLSTGDLTIFVSKKAAGPGFDESLGRFQGKLPCVLPSDDRDLPAPQYLRWHYDEVFRGRLQVS